MTHQSPERSYTSILTYFPVVWKMSGLWETFWLLPNRVTFLFDLIGLIINEIWSAFLTKLLSRRKLKVQYMGRGQQLRQRLPVPAWVTVFSLAHQVLTVIEQTAQTLGVSTSVFAFEISDLPAVRFQLLDHVLFTYSPPSIRLPMTTFESQLHHS